MSSLYLYTSHTYPQWKELLKIRSFPEFRIDLIASEGLSTNLTASEGLSTDLIAREGLSLHLTSRGLSTDLTARGLSTYLTVRGLSTDLISRCLSTDLITRGLPTDITARGLSTDVSARGLSAYPIARGLSTDLAARGLSTDRTAIGISTNLIARGMSTDLSVTGQSTDQKSSLDLPFYERRTKYLSYNLFILFRLVIEHTHTVLINDINWLALLFHGRKFKGYQSLSSSADQHPFDNFKKSSCSSPYWSLNIVLSAWKGNYNCHSVPSTNTLRYSTCGFV